MPVHFEKLKVIRDVRGSVFEPLPGDALTDKRNVHVVISGPGVVRGNHYHRRGRETMAVMGPALVRVRDENGVQDIQVPAGEVYRFIFLPGQAHAIQNLSNNPNILVAFNTVEHDRQSPDAEPEALL